ncbi:unnamed protein product [Cylicocyclus nassatus]|uniref:GDP-fucose pyrophosphorylase domain-containing protein n=1 Tax=Cylicocyclus nassatus TaxID=53992 RepID=A0AA36GUD5_CYLNA|nr:unnamed protein product [Cylicocyclus nassatus]
MEKWDVLLLTAGSEKQKQDFELILSKEDLTSYCKKALVIADYPAEVRIGSGGATLNVLSTLRQLVDKKILLVHSGGLSQRVPHLSALGKIFATLPDGSTILEKKLISYKHLPSILPPGMLVSASDVAEDVSKFEKCDSPEMIVSATESSLEEAKDRGVLALDSDGKLKTVLQKPTLELIKDSGAVLPSGNALSYCFYWLSWSICEQLAALWRDRGPCKVETCWGDFMQPLGYAPSLDYLNEEIFSKTKPQVVNLGIDSYFHLGTPQELMAHCRRESTFARKFLPLFLQSVYCSLEDCSIGSGSLVEYCKLKDANIGEECIINGCESTKLIQIRNKTMVFTLCIKDNGGRFYTTVFLRTDDDVKEKKEKLFWMGRETSETNVSLWQTNLFPVEQTREMSLQTTLKMLEGAEFDGQKISIGGAVAKSDLEEMISFRQSLKHQPPTSSP